MKVEGLPHNLVVWYEVKKCLGKFIEVLELVQTVRPMGLHLFFYVCVCVLTF